MKTKASNTIVVVYENSTAREAAVKACDAYVRKFWGQCGFDLSWWSFADLEDVQHFRDSAEKAAVADLVVFALEPAGKISLGVKTWMDKWLALRGSLEGAMVGLEESAPAVGAHLGDCFQYLRSVARKAGLDYLTQMPAGISRGLPNSLESCSDRAVRVTGLLDEILQPLHPPTYPDLQP